MSYQTTSADRCWQLGTGEVLHSEVQEPQQPLPLEPKEEEGTVRQTEGKFQKQSIPKGSVKKKAQISNSIW